MKRRDEVLVGVFVTIALIVGISGTLWLARRGLGGGYPLYSRFEWGANLKTGQPVLLAGVQIGNVDNVALQRDGHLLVTMKIEKAQTVPEGTRAKVISVGLFGDAALALTPPRQFTNQSLPPRDTIPAEKPAATIDDMLARVDTVGRRVSDMSQALDLQMVQGGGIADLRATIGSTNRLIAQLNTIAAEQSRGISATLASLRRTTNAIDSSTVDSTVRNVKAMTRSMAMLTDSLQQTSTRLNGVLTKLESGHGSAAMLLNDTTLYSNTRNLLARLDSLTADFKKNPKKYINLKIF
ncbi:MAG: MlaD family protein [Gemmatimonadota bacterium]|nr:MlaD family protein [Gemmatimonadota bacterium]